VWTNWRAIGKTTFDERALGDARDLARGAARDVYTAIKREIETMGQRPQFGERAFQKGTGRGETQHAHHENPPDIAASDNDDDIKMEI
jgi:exosome complex component RRP46